MDMHTIYNYIEGVVWQIIAMATLLLFYRKSIPDALLLMVSFIIFGISDFIEVQTGAWWRPWWLLVMKGLCLVGIAFAIYRLKKQNSGKIE